MLEVLERAWKPCYLVSLQNRSDSVFWSDGVRPACIL